MSGGFERPVYVVEFPPASRYHGLVVKTRSVSFDRLMEIQQAVAALPTTEAQLAGIDAAESSRLVGQLAGSFSDALIDWNLEGDDDQPVPATAEQLQKEDGTMVLAIVVRWLDIVIDVDAELGKDSASGGPSPALSELPMEALSGSPAS